MPQVTRVRPWLRFFNSITIRDIPVEIEEFPVDSDRPVLFEGARRAATIVEDGYEVYAGEPPPVHEELAEAGLVVTNKTTGVRPWSHDGEGSPTAYIRTWNYTYKTTELLDSGEKIVALEKKFLAR